MGVLSDLIIANRDEAPAIIAAGGGHLTKWECLESKGIDPIKLSDLWHVISGEGKADDSSYMTDQVLAQPSTEGPWLFPVPRELVSALAKLDKSEVEQVSEKWMATGEFRFENWDSATVTEYLAELSEFAKKSQASGKEMLLWMCL